MVPFASFLEVGSTFMIARKEWEKTGNGNTRNTRDTRNTEAMEKSHSHTPTWVRRDETARIGRRLAAK